MIKLPKSTVKYIIIFLAFVIITISFWLPLSETINLCILGENSIDLNGALWYQWFAKRCIFKFDFASLYHTDFIAYPTGKNLLFDLGPPLIAILSIPFQIVLNLPAYYNIFMVVLMAVNGIACFMLLNHIYKDALSAFIGGLFFCINPYVFYQANSGRPEQTAIFWIPLFILFLLKMKERKNKTYPIIAALLLVLASLSYWYYGIFLLIFTVLFLLYFFFLKKDDILNLAKNTTLLLCLYCVCMFLLFFYPVLVLGIYPGGYELIKPFPAFKDILLNKTPAYFNYMIRHTATHNLPYPFLATTVTIIVLSLLNVKSWKNNLFYIITASFFFILALGPYLEISGHVIALPYILLYYIIPFFSRLWWPINCFSVVLACMAILLAGLIHWIRSKANSTTKIIFPVILVIMHLLPYYNAQYNVAGYLPWLKMQAFDFYRFHKPHKAYYYLKELQNCAIIELPFNKVRLEFFRNQIIHEKKVFECPGYAIKEIAWTKEHLQYLNSNALLKYLDLLFSRGAPLDGLSYQNFLNEQSLKTGLKQLYASGFRFIVIKPSYLLGYRSADRIFNELKRIFKKPFKEYPEGLLLYRIEDLINE